MAKFQRLHKCYLKSWPGLPYEDIGDYGTIYAINTYGDSGDSMTTKVICWSQIATIALAPLATKVPVDYKCWQWSFNGDNGSNGIIGDSCANGLQMMPLVPMNGRNGANGNIGSNPHPNPNSCAHFLSIMPQKPSRISTACDHTKYLSWRLVKWKSGELSDLLEECHSIQRAFRRYEKNPTES